LNFQAYQRPWELLRKAEMLLENTTAGVAQTVAYRPASTPPDSVVIMKTPADVRPVRLQVPAGNPGHATDDPVGIVE